MLYFCTLFDSNYLTRGLAMHRSLAKTHNNFHLYIFAFDSLALEVLNTLNLPHVTVISLAEFEDPELLRIKPTRSPMEYCWTCTPSVILYCINHYRLQQCTYLDADLYFFGSSEPIFDELKESKKDLLITEHRFTKRYSEYAANGIYNVQFMVFNNTSNGLKVLNWWRDRCIEWCYARIEDGKLGDQKYLDHWPEQFEGVHILQHRGGALGPWNIQQYSLLAPTGNDQLAEVIHGNQKYLAIFYHFHNYKFYAGGYSRAINYDLSKEIIELIYQPYLSKVMTEYQMVAAKFPKMNDKGFQPKDEDPTYIINCLQRGDYDGDNIVIYDAEKFKVFTEYRPIVPSSQPKILRKLKNASGKLVRLAKNIVKGAGISL